MSVSQKYLADFVNLVVNLDLYNEGRKEVFHRNGKRILKEIATRLGLPNKSYDIRSNKGGIAVSGEVTLHGENIYISFAQHGTGSNSMGFMYRSCKGRKDFTGGANNWMKWRELMDLDIACDRFKRVLPAAA